MQARYRSHQWSGQRDLNSSIMNMTQWQYLMERTPGWPAVPDKMHRAPNPSPHSFDTHFPFIFECESMAALQETLPRLG